MSEPEDRPTASEVRPGHLYVVATPIGNLGDLSPRAASILANVDRICAEDTRTSGRLLAHFGIDRPLLALHDHNEAAIVDRVVGGLKEGQALALVSDAGTPLISDPGFALVRAARAAGIPVIAIPGPCAAIAALSIAGLPSDGFSFVGFLPAKSRARRERLGELASEPRTLVLYESPHRIEDSLADLVEVIGAERPICLARELTKRFEESVTAPAGEVLKWLRGDANRQRGEFVLVIAPAPSTSPADADADRLLRALLAELSPARAARVAAELSGLPRQQLYRRALDLGGSEDDAPPSTE